MACVLPLNNPQLPPPGNLPVPWHNPTVLTPHSHHVCSLERTPACCVAQGAIALPFILLRVIPQEEIISKPLRDSFPLSEEPLLVWQISTHHVSPPPQSPEYLCVITLMSLI